jgi:hypothetical protein
MQFKTYKALLVALMLSLAVAACNNSKDEKKEGGETKDSTVAPAPAPAPAPATTDSTAAPTDSTGKGDANEKPVKNPD